MVITLSANSRYKFRHNLERTSTVTYLCSAWCLMSHGDKKILHIPYFQLTYITFLVHINFILSKIPVHNFSTEEVNCLFTSRSLPSFILCICEQRWRFCLQFSRLTGDYGTNFQVPNLTPPSHQLQIMKVTQKYWTASIRGITEPTLKTKYSINLVLLCWITSKKPHRKTKCITYYYHPAIPHTHTE